VLSDGDGNPRGIFDGSGYFLLGLTSQPANLGKIATYATSGTNVGWSSYGSANGYYAAIFQNDSNTTVGNIQVNASTTNFAITSDYRLKENVQPMTGALNTIAQLKPVTYDWIATKEKGQGFIAHELQAIVPDCVTGEKDAVDANGRILPQGVDTSFLVATLTAAIQELKAEFDAYKATHP
jgi:hypothetical protein